MHTKFFFQSYFVNARIAFLVYSLYLMTTEIAPSDAYMRFQHMIIRLRLLGQNFDHILLMFYNLTQCGCLSTSTPQACAEALRL